MKDDAVTIVELTRSAAMARFRVLAFDGEEHGEYSRQRATCHIHRGDVSWAAVPLIYAIGALSFADARPRESSEIDHEEKDEWLFADLLTRLRLQRDMLAFDADYVRGRMMKTHVTVHSNGSFIIETSNRYEMVRRWLDALKGRSHLRLVAAKGEGVLPRA